MGAKRDDYYLIASYEKFLIYRETLRQVAVAAMDYTKQGYVQELFEYRGNVKQKSVGLSDQVYLPGWDDLAVVGDFAFILNGKFYPAMPPFFRALFGMDVSRLRTCPICDRIFWAYRTDALTCSKQHGTVLRTRKWREGKKAHEEKLKKHFQPRRKK